MSRFVTKQLLIVVVCCVVLLFPIDSDRVPHGVNLTPPDELGGWTTSRKIRPLGIVLFELVSKRSTGISYFSETRRYSLPGSFVLPATAKVIPIYPGSTLLKNYADRSGWGISMRTDDSYETALDKYKKMLLDDGWEIEVTSTDSPKQTIILVTKKNPQRNNRIYVKPAPTEAGTVIEAYTVYYP